MRDDKTLKLTLFSLQKFIRVRSIPAKTDSYFVDICDTQEEQFANEFLNRDGLRELVDVINASHGNTLAVRLNLCALHTCLPQILCSMH